MEGVRAGVAFLAPEVLALHRGTNATHCRCKLTAPCFSCWAVAGAAPPNALQGSRVGSLSGGAVALLCYSTTLTTTHAQGWSPVAGPCANLLVGPIPTTPTPTPTRTFGSSSPFARGTTSVDVIHLGACVRITSYTHRFGRGTSSPLPPPASFCTNPHAMSGQSGERSVPAGQH